jgi:hypothetical protein
MLVAVASGLAVGDGREVGVWVGSGVGVAVGVAVGSGALVAVAVGVGTGVSVGSGKGVAVGGLVGGTEVAVGAGVAVASAPQAVISIAKTIKRTNDCFIFHPSCLRTGPDIVAARDRLDVGWARSSYLAIEDWRSAAFRCFRDRQSFELSLFPPPDRF